MEFHEHDDEEPVRPSRARVLPKEEEEAWNGRRRNHPSDENDRNSVAVDVPKDPGLVRSETLGVTSQSGHGLTYLLLFSYTALANFRPWELTPALTWLAPTPYWLALTMLGLFLVTQLMVDGNLTARPREVHLVLILTVLAFLSIPQAINPFDAWAYFNGVFLKTIIVFLVIVNAVRTRRRLMGMIFLALITGCFLSATSMTHYFAGHQPKDYRARAEILNIFNDPNALALHLVMMIPIALALLLSTPNVVKKLIYAAGIVIMVAGTFASLSRGGFLALVAVGAMLLTRFMRRNRLLVVALMLVAIFMTVILTPGGYGERLSSIIDPSRDTVHSADSRRALLFRSIVTAFRRPILGVGIGNFQTVSIHNQVTHNAYTQVAAEMGLIALGVYVLFLITCYKRLRKIETETLKQPRFSKFYYLSVGLQASLVGYMVGSFFLSVAFEWFLYFLVGYAICLSRLYEAEVLPEARPQALDYATSLSTRLPATTA